MYTGSLFILGNLGSPLPGNLKSRWESEVCEQIVGSLMTSKCSGFFLGLLHVNGMFIKCLMNVTCIKNDYPPNTLVAWLKSWRHKCGYTLSCIYGKGMGLYIGTLSQELLLFIPDFKLLTSC